MKKVMSFILIFGVFVSFSFFQASVLKGQEESSIRVEEAVICRDVVDRQPVDPGESFEASVHKLFCFTRIVGAQEPVEITHIWYWKETERARVTLPVESPNWRTWSSKIIQEHEVGEWHVDIIGPEGNVLKTVTFEILE